MPQTPASSAARPSAKAPAEVGAVSAAPHPTPEGKVVVTPGTHIPLVLHNGISTRTARAGDPVYLETVFPILVDAHVVIPAGSYVSGVITESKRPGRVKGVGISAYSSTP
jgi:hypothetical protein